MPDKLHRCYGAGYLHFITTSCYRRPPLLGKPQNRDLLLKVLELVRRRYRFVVVGYVLMPEHIHLLVGEPERGDPSKVMQAIKQGFARRLLRGLRATSPRPTSPSPTNDARQGTLWNTALDKSHIWQTRFYDFIVFTEKKRVEKAALHASQPGETGTGAGTATMAMEQLSPLRRRRARPGVCK